MVCGRADCIWKPWCADILWVMKADWSMAWEMPTAPSPFPRLGSWVAGRRWRKKNAFYLAMVLPVGRLCPGTCGAVGRSPAGTKGMGGCWLHPTRESQSNLGTSTCIPEVMRQPLLGNGMCLHHLLWACGSKHCDHQQPLHLENSLSRQGKKR